MADQQHTTEAARAILGAAIEKAGSASAWGRRNGFGSAYVIVVQRGVKPPSDRLLAALGLVRRVEIVDAPEVRS